MAIPTCRAIIRDALRKLKAIDPREPVPASDASDGLIGLQGLYDSWISGGVFGRLTDVLVTADYTAGENERVVINTADPVTVSTPDTITDACTGQVRPPRNLACIEVAGAAPRRYLWDASLAAWTSIPDLTLDSPAPLAVRDRDGLACALAVALSDDYDGTPGAATIARAAGHRSGLSNKRDDVRASTPAEYF